MAGTYRQQLPCHPLHAPFAGSDGAIGALMHQNNTHSVR
jgi:hypothetical protein